MTGPEYCLCPPLATERAMITLGCQFCLERWGLDCQLEAGRIEGLPHAVAVEGVRQRSIAAGTEALTASGHASVRAR